MATGLRQHCTSLPPTLPCTMASFLQPGYGGTSGVLDAVRRLPIFPFETSHQKETRFRWVQKVMFGSNKGQISGICVFFPSSDSYGVLPTVATLRVPSMGGLGLHSLGACLLFALFAELPTKILTTLNRYSWFGMVVWAFEPLAFAEGTPDSQLLTFNPQFQTAKLSEADTKI